MVRSVRACEVDAASAMLGIAAAVQRDGGRDLTALWMKPQFMAGLGTREVGATAARSSEIEPTITCFGKIRRDGMTSRLMNNRCG